MRPDLQLVVSGEKVSATDVDLSDPHRARSVVVPKRVDFEWPARGSLQPGTYGPRRHWVNQPGAVFVVADPLATVAPGVVPGHGELVGLKPGEFYWIEGDHDGAFCPLEGMVELARIGGNPDAEFAAHDLLRAWCVTGGWLLGPLQREDPMGLLLTPDDDVVIEKWRDLTDAVRRALDGCVCWIGSPRHGTAVVFLRESLVDAVTNP